MSDLKTLCSFWDLFSFSLFKVNCGHKGSQFKRQREKEIVICSKRSSFFTSALPAELLPPSPMFSVFHFWFMTVKMKVEWSLGVLEGYEILKNKITICYGFGKRRWLLWVLFLLLHYHSVNTYHMPVGYRFCARCTTVPTTELGTFREFHTWLLFLYCQVLLIVPLYRGEN